MMSLIIKVSFFDKIMEFNRMNNVKEWFRMNESKKIIGSMKS